jgi:hypothetical protein
MLSIFCLTYLLNFTATYAAPDFPNPKFQQLWEYNDKYVDEIPGSGRGFTWGPRSIVTQQEDYLESPGGKRVVEYFDKSRMELSLDGTYVTNGLLTKELVTGQRQVGNAKFIQMQPSTVQVAGDDNNTGSNAIAPVYASFKNVVTIDTGNPIASDKTGKPVTQSINNAGVVNTLNNPPDNVIIGYYEPILGHNVPKIFQDYQNLTGKVWNGSTYVQGKVYTDNPVANVFGYPISEPFWIRAAISGQEKDVLVQLFERRVLTYTPSNSAEYKVEMGNIGKHYYQWITQANAPTPPAKAEIRQPILDNSQQNFVATAIITSDNPDTITKVEVVVKDEKGNLPAVTLTPAFAKQIQIEIPVAKLTMGRTYTITISAKDKNDKYITGLNQQGSTELASTKFTYQAPPPITAEFAAIPQLDKNGENYTAKLNISSDDLTTIDKILIEVLDNKGQAINPPLAPLAYNAPAKTVEISIPAERLRLGPEYTINIKAKTKAGSDILSPKNETTLATTKFSYPITTKLGISKIETKDGGLILPIDLTVQDEGQQLEKYKVDCKVEIQSNGVNILSNPYTKNTCNIGNEKTPNTWHIDLPIKADQMQEGKDYDITVELLTPGSTRLNIPVSVTFKAQFRPAPGFFETYGLLTLIFIFIMILIIFIFVYVKSRPRKKVVPAPLPYKEKVNPYSDRTMMDPATFTRLQNVTIMQEPPKPKLRVRVLQTLDPSQIREEVFNNYPLIIGRSNGKFIITGDPKISGKHVEIYEKAGVLTIVDLNSTNDTIVDNQKLGNGGKINITKRVIMQLGPDTTLELVPEK